MASYTRIETLASSFARALRAENKSPRTVRTYIEAVTMFSRFLESAGRSTEAGAIGASDVRAFLADILDRLSPGTASNRYRALKVFFRWVVEEGEAGADPMAGVRPPAVEESPPPVVTPDMFRKLVKACEGQGFEERRDAAILWLLLDTGVRNAELLGMQLGDVDLDAGTILVMGKGRRARVIRYGRRAALALDRYLRARGRHPWEHSERLWIGSKGPLGDSAIRLMLRRRCRKAGIPKIHPHQFRHTFAHMSLAAGANEGDLMQLAGWKSRQMLNRYGASAAAERARAAHKKFSPGDQI